MITMPPGFLRGLAALCRAHEVLLVCDEVAVGFGRTGPMFACEHEDVTPDLMTVGKGITGGYLPLAATFTTDEIYEAFLGELRGPAHLLPRPLLHRKPARLRRRDRQPRPVRA